MLSMYDKALIIEILKNIAWSLEQVIKRFKAIKSSDDFLKMILVWKGWIVFACR